MVVTSTASIQSILEQQSPPLEDEIREYLQGFLSDTIEVMDDDDDNDAAEAILDVLEQFVNDKDQCQKILSSVLAMKSSASASASTSTPTSTSPSKVKHTPDSIMSTNTTRLVADPSSTHNTGSSDVSVLRDRRSAAVTVSPVASSDDDDHGDKKKDENNIGEEKEEKVMSKKERRERRKQQRMKKNGGKKSKKNQDVDGGSGGDDDDDKNNNNEFPAQLIDDHASAWQERQQEGKLWGGRGHGGRGVRYTGENLDSIHLHSVSIQFAGNELLVDSPMDIVKGHRYGLLGRNGVGKSTLLRQLANNTVPGLPQSMRILLVQQQIQGRSDQTALEALMEADTDRVELLQEQEKVEAELEAGNDLEANAERLGNIVAELDAMDADGAEDRARSILKGLKFKKAMMEGPTENLSGGWRMRLALAQALYVPHSDLILLDECTNHLDLQGMGWLINYINTAAPQLTLMVVSHDRTFLDAICTDIVVMEHKRLSYHVGSYSEYRRQMDEKAARDGQILDAAERQRSKAMAFIQKHQQNQHGTSKVDPNKQRQAKMIKTKKLDRIGNFREDGKRYKNFSLKQMDMQSARLSEKVHIERDEAVIKLNFPDPTWPQAISETSNLIHLDDVSFGYDASGPFLLHNMTFQLTRGSKVALVGHNGCGKTTLLRLLTGEGIDGAKITGKVWRHPSLRIGHVTQYSVEELETFAHMTVVEYAEKKLSSCKASSTVIAQASGNVRQYLGGFGLGGVHAHRTIQKLSGGERMRLCFATVLADEPHILFLDESTNHVDLETLDSMSGALNRYKGAVLMVSHNQGFLSGFCNELWVLENGRVTVSHDDTESFDELFSNYRNHVMSSTEASGRQNARQTKAKMARKAAKQSMGTKQNATLLG